MLVFQRTKIKSVNYYKKITFNFVFYVVLLLAVDISSLLSKKSILIVHSREYGVVRLSGYSPFYKDDTIYYNDDDEYHPLPYHSADQYHKSNNYSKMSDDTQAELPPHRTSVGRSDKKHHKHRHKNKKVKDETNESFEIFFNKLAAKTDTGDTDEAVREIEDFLTVGNEELKYHNVETEFNSFSSQSSNYDNINNNETPLEDIDDFLSKELKETHHHHHHHKNKVHNKKMSHEIQTEINPYLFKIDYVNPTVQELIMMTPELSHLDIPWPVKKEAIVEGDVNLGGLMMVHSREDGVTCGPIMPQGGIQALEAMLYTLDILNTRLRLVPNVTIGAHILDDCDKDTYGLEMAVDFIKGIYGAGSPGYELLLILGAEALCGGPGGVESEVFFAANKSIGLKPEKKKL